MWRWLLLGFTAALALALGSSGAALAQRGLWARLQVPGSGSTVDVYVPREATLDASSTAGRGASAVIFLHAAGRPPESYRGTLGEAADSLGVVLLMPKATTSFGWGFEGDFALIEASVAKVASLVPLDPAKVAIAGHGDGGSYGYLLAYLSDLRLSAVFTLGAPFLPISGLFDPEGPPPIRMVFGVEDPVYRADAGRLREQWSTLGIDWQLDVLPGFGHSTWPQEVVLEGFRFLAERISRPTRDRCITSRTALCLGRGRFRIEVTYADFGGRPGRGKALAEETSESGIFWFFDSDNWEVMVKVLDGCSLNDSFWVFAAASTNADYRVTVTDQVTGRIRQYQHEPGSPAPAVTDTAAFPGCSPAS
jgi:hypothetical protein